MELQLEYLEQYRYLERNRFTGELRYGPWVTGRVIAGIPPIKDPHHVSRDQAAIEYYERFRIQHEALTVSQVRLVRRWVSELEPVELELHKPIRHPTTWTSDE